MSAKTWISGGTDAAEDFWGYNGNHITLAREGHLLYIEVTDQENGESMSVPVKGSEIINMAHWIIKEFG